MLNSLLVLLGFRKKKARRGRPPKKKGYMPLHWQKTMPRKVEYFEGKD